MFSRISEIKRIREQKSRLAERERELAAPLLTDLGEIGRIYGWFKEIVAEREPFRPGSVSQRKKFIFIILFLYSPGTLAGGKMRSGLREALTSVLGLRGRSAISDNANGLAFHYRLYKYFRRDVDWIYGRVMERLGKPGTGVAGKNEK